jgi:hypothetical protein
MSTRITNAIYRTHSKAISCTKQFCISDENAIGSSSQLLFQAPSCSIITNEIKSIGAYTHFMIRKSDLDSLKHANLEIHHIVEYMQDLSSKNFSYDGCRMYVYLIGNSALFIVKRITDYLFAQVFNFESAEDLLYYIQACFHSLKLDKSLDQLILCGEIESDSKIVRLISVYFSNMITDSALPLSSLTL